MIKLIGVLVAGIPALITAIFAAIGRKWVTVAAALALAVSLTVAFIATINTILGGLTAYLAVPDWIANAIGMFIPSNFAVVLAAIVAARIARGAYDLAMTKTRLFASAS